MKQVHIVDIHGPGPDYELHDCLEITEAERHYGLTGLLTKALVEDEQPYFDYGYGWMILINEELSAEETENANSED